MVYTQVSYFKTLYHNESIAEVKSGHNPAKWVSYNNDCISNRIDTC